MYKAKDIAAWLIKRDNAEPDKKNNEPIGLLKLMKLLYYCQGAFLAIDNKSLFREVIEAWEWGPVVPEVYYIFDCDDIDKKDLHKYISLLGETSEIDSFTEELLEEVYQSIGKKYTGYELISKTHQETPWLKATNNGTLLRKKRIPRTQIKEYFKEVYTCAA